MNNGTVWLSCGVVRAELEALHRQGLIRGRLHFLDSMLHMDPPRLETALTAALEQRLQTPACLVLVYGDCCSRMLDLVTSYRVGRIDAINCAQLLLGRDRYRHLMREGAFLVLPEWADRWERIMQDELGLTHPIAQDLMREHRSSLVYLDTGLVPVPHRQMTDFSAYSGLPWRIETVTLDTMLQLLLTAEADAHLRAGTDRP